MALEPRLLIGICQQIAAVEENAGVNVARDLQQRAIDACQLEQRRREIRQFSFRKVRIKGKQPRLLGGSILDVGRDDVVAGRTGGVDRVYVRIQLRMGQLHADVDCETSLLLELRQATVERIILRPADEGYVELILRHVALSFPAVRPDTHKRASRNSSAGDKSRRYVMRRSPRRIAFPPKSTSVG